MSGSDLRKSRDEKRYNESITERVSGCLLLIDKERVTDKTYI
jgi:hypothetical protein